MHKLKVIAVCAGLVLSTSATQAVAGPSHHGYRHFTGHAPHYRHYRHYRHHRHGHHSNRGAYLAGGIILGSVLTHALTRHRHHEYHDPYYEQETRVIRHGPSYTRRSAEPVRRLFRDRDGNCFEKQYNDRGDEILLELDPAECAW